MIMAIMHGTKQATELRDGGKAYQGQGVTKAVGSVNGPIFMAIRGMDPADQVGTDKEVVVVVVVVVVVAFATAVLTSQSPTIDSDD